MTNQVPPGNTITMQLTIIAEAEVTKAADVHKEEDNS